MRKEKNTGNTERQESIIKIVDVSTDQHQLEIEIDRQVKTLRALIRKLQPIERQRYFDGLLSHMLSQPVQYPEFSSHINDSYDYCNLSVDELSLIKELSVKVHELYQLAGGDPE
jgi:hypothetical protein